jgi:phosphatidylglycerol:prolipoprotein diacylglycerol transferase
MYPILGRFGPFFLYSYTAVFGLGLLLSLALLARDNTPRRLPPRWLDAVVVALLAALAGGRLLFVLVHRDYFQLYPDELWLFSRGGLSYLGALAAALLALILWSHYRVLSFMRLTAALAPGAALWACFGWAACWLEGCAYGRPAPSSFFVADLPDSFGVMALRYQTQLLGVFISLIAFIILWRARRRLPPAPLFWLALGLLSASQALVSLWRGDDVPTLGSWRLDTIVNGALALVALLLVVAWRARVAGSKRNSELVER